MVLVNACINGIGDACLECWYPELEFYCLPIFVNYQVLTLFGAKIIDYDEKEILRYQMHKVLRVPERAIDIADILPEEYQSRLPRIQARAQLLGVTEIKRPVATIPAEIEEWADEQIEKVNPDGKPIIILAPQCSKLTRAWLPNYWLELALALEKDYFTLAIWYQNLDYGKFFPHSIQGATINHTAALLKRATKIIAPDTGIVHLAGTLDIPVLALTGPTDGLCFWHLPSVETMSFNLPCTGCYFQPALYKIPCGQGCRAMCSITPEMVLNKIYDNQPR